MRGRRVWGALCVAGAVLCGATAVSAEVPVAGRPERDLAAIRDALADRAVASPARRQDAADASPIVRATPDTLDQIVDPVFDVSDGRGDITAASVLADGETQIVSTMIVRQFSNPFTDPNWVVGTTGALWSFDRNLDAIEDYYAIMFNINGSLVAGVFDTNDNFICDAVTFADPVMSMYAVVFQPSCIGLPFEGGGSFQWGATMGYDLGPTVQFDDAPDTTWSGPVFDLPDPPLDPTSLNTVVPARVLDTRAAGLTIDGQARGTGRQPAGSVLQLTVAGRGGVPNTASAALLNVTAVLPATGGFLTVYPCGSATPGASNVNYQAGQIVPNAVLAKVGVDGKVCIFTLADTDIIVDVNGFVPAGASPTPVDPLRYLETRPGQPNGGTFDGQGAGAGRSPAGSVTEVLVAGRGTVPADASAVMLNVTAVFPDGPGYLTVYACGSPPPPASHVNYQPNQVSPNAVLSAIGTGGKVCISTLTGTDILVDVNGYVAAAGTLKPLTPGRVLETRPATEGFTVDGQFLGIGRRAAGSVTEIQVAGRAAVPSGAGSVLMNVTAVNPDGDGFLTVWPCDAERPIASNVNYRAGQVTPNAVVSQLSASGSVCVYTFAQSDVIIDVNGYVP